MCFLNSIALAGNQKNSICMAPAGTAEHLEAIQSLGRSGNYMSKLDSHSQRHKGTMAVLVVPGDT